MSLESYPQPSKKERSSTKQHDPATQQAAGSIEQRTENNPAKN
jgi:hypothetical protein